MSKKQSKVRSKQLIRLKILRDKRILLEKKQKLRFKSNRLSKKIQKENQRIKQLKRETGARKFINLTNLVKSARNTADTLKKIDKQIQKAKKKW